MSKKEKKKNKLIGVLIKTNGEFERVEYVDEYGSVSKIIGCQYIESINIVRNKEDNLFNLENIDYQDIFLYCDEEGLMKENPKSNQLASLIQNSKTPNRLFGNVMLTKEPNGFSQNECQEILNALTKIKENN